MKPDYPFTTDGCSGGMSAFWRLIFRCAPPWEDLCIAHDKAYWKGGSRHERLKADRELLIGVIESGYPLIGFLMYYSVRFGGHPILPLPWRWSYGWKWLSRTDY